MAPTARTTTSRARSFLSDIKRDRGHIHIDNETIDSRIILSAGSIGICCNSRRTLRGASLSFRGNRVATLVKPSNYNGSALLHDLGLVGHRVHNYHIRNRVGCHKHGIGAGARGACRLHHSVNVIFRRPGPFHGSVHSGVAFTPEHRNVASHSRLSHVIRRDLHNTTL